MVEKPRDARRGLTRYAAVAMRTRGFIARLAIYALAACGREQRLGFQPDPPLAPPPDGCVGRGCKRAPCADGRTTTLAGRVTDPAGRRGLYNVVVYVPNGNVRPLARGASCDACSTRVVDAAVSTLTDVRGEFVLHDVPVDLDVPVVIELGRWRRTAHVDVTACATVRLADEKTRLPRNSSEGDLPEIAVTTGAADALECLLRNVGIDEREFVAGDAPGGRVHVYAGKGGGGLAGSFAPSAADLWNDASRLAAHDIVVLSCEGDPANEIKGGTQPAARGAMATYLERGGHVFATHFHSTWLATSPSQDLREIASWADGAESATEYEIVTGFPKGDAFADWLVVTGASISRAAIRLDNVTVSVAAIREPEAQAWVRRGPTVRYFSFNTPVGAPRDGQCGRFVFSDLHAFGLGGSDFPVGCPPRDASLSPQQLALEFLLFDLFSCVDDDRAQPLPPR